MPEDEIAETQDEDSEDEDRRLVDMGTGDANLLDEDGRFDKDVATAQLVELEVSRGIMAEGPRGNALPPVNPASLAETIPSYVPPYKHLDPMETWRYDVAVHYMNSGVPARQIAASLGLKRGRIYQIWNDYRAYALSEHKKVTPDEHLHDGLNNYKKLNDKGWEEFERAATISKDDPVKGAQIRLVALNMIRRAQKDRDTLLKMSGYYQETKKVLNVYEFVETDSWKEIQEATMNFFTELEKRLMKQVGKEALSKMGLYRTDKDGRVYSLCDIWLEFLEGHRLEPDTFSDKESLYHSRNLGDIIETSGEEVREVGPDGSQEGHDDSGAEDSEGDKEHTAGLDEGREV